MKVAFYEPYALNTPHFERCLELMQRHIDDGDEVLLLGCDGNFAACDVNLFHYKAICQVCIQRKKNGLALIQGNYKYKNYRNLSPAQEKEIQSFLKQVQYTNLQELKNVKYQDFDAGYSVASSLISHLRTPKLDVKRFGALISTYLKDSIELFVSLSNHIKEEKVERLYVFNGRQAHLRPGIRAAEFAGIDFYTHEVATDLGRYSLVKNALPHSIKAKELQIRELWATAAEEIKAAGGAAFFEDQVKGNVISKKYHYTANQVTGLLPENWDNQKHNIVIFNSSEDEFEAIGDEWKEGVYPSQSHGIQALVKAFENNENFHLFLRIHPNLQYARKEAYENLFQIKAKNFTIIEPTSTISTYALVSAANKVVTFSSSVGIEAAYRNKPAIILGASLYKSLGSTYNPQSHEETIALLQDLNLPAKDNTGALMYGYYMKNFGTPYKYYQPETLFKGKYRGKDINPNWITTEVAKFFMKLQGYRKSRL